MLFFFLLGEVGSTAGLQEALIHTHTWEVCVSAVYSDCKSHDSPAEKSPLPAPRLCPYMVTNGVLLVLWLPTHTHIQTRLHTYVCVTGFLPVIWGRGGSKLTTPPPLPTPPLMENREVVREFQLRLWVELVAVTWFIFFFLSDLEHVPGSVLSPDEDCWQKCRCLSAAPVTSSPLNANY